MTPLRRPRVVLALGVAMLLLTAGCGGLTSNGGTTTTPGGTGTTTTATTATTATADGISFPTGFGPEGTVDDAAALNGHTNVLVAKNNFTFVFISETEAGGETVNTTLVNRVDADRRLLLRTVSRPDAVATQYVVGGTAYTRIEPRDNRAVRYRSTPEEVDPRAATARPVVGNMMRGVDWEDPKQVTVEGEPAVRYEAAGLANASAVLDVEAGAVESFEATLVVATNGVVRRASYTATYTRDGQRVTDRVTVRFEAIGSTTVNEPAWVDRQF